MPWDVLSKSDRVAVKTQAKVRRSPGKSWGGRIALKHRRHRWAVHQPLVLATLFPRGAALSRPPNEASCIPEAMCYCRYSVVAGACCSGSSVKHKDSLSDAERTTDNRRLRVLTIPINQTIQRGRRERRVVLQFTYPL